ncbi:glycosyltransferase family 2 protein [Robertmurraya sp.]|uniref:glycosyltransferase family 2 protein n=1 Tax=Robertmurraya sp. TaxID=2837525 RepID=UPI0037040334
MKPFISLIVPVYNGEKFLRKCLESLVSQTYKDYEIIIINDGSTDNSKSICDEFNLKYKNFRVINIENGGVSNARNIGIEQSRGEFISFVDSDDFVGEKYLEIMVRKIEESNVDMVICGIKQVENSDICKVVSELLCPKPGYIHKENLGVVIKDLINSSYINYCYSKLIKRSLLIDNQIKFNNNLDLGEDTLFVIECLKYVDSIHLISKSSYYYLINSSSNSLTHKIRKNKFGILNYISKYIYEFCEKSGFLNNELEKSLIERYFKIIQFCLDENLNLRQKGDFLRRLKSISLILNHPDVINFLNKNKDNLSSFPKVIINSIRTRNSIIYIATYYLLILTRKVKSTL